MSVVDADKPGYTYWDGNGNMPTSPYYRVEWFHLTKEWGAPASDNGYNTPDVSIAYSTYHLDARITFSDMCNVDFMVKEPGKENFERLDVRTYSAAYSKGTSESYVIKPQDHGYNVNQFSGYVFDGWYEDEACTQKAEFNGTLNEDKVYYGRFIKESSNLKISKTVTGLLGDTKKAFTFTIKPTDSTKTFTITESDFIEKSDEGVTYDLSKKTFTLTHGAYITLSLPVGTYYVQEDSYDNYTVSAKINGVDTTVTDRAVTAELTKEAMTIAFTNCCTLEPDTGVLLDTLPYIVILAVVAGGVALLMLRKHRKEDD